MDSRDFEGLFRNKDEVLATPGLEKLHLRLIVIRTLNSLCFRTEPLTACIFYWRWRTNGQLSHVVTLGSDSLGASGFGIVGYFGTNVLPSCDTQAMLTCLTPAESQSRLSGDTRGGKLLTAPQSHQRRDSGSIFTWSCLASRIPCLTTSASSPLGPRWVPTGGALSKRPSCERHHGYLPGVKPVNMTAAEPASQVLWSRTASDNLAQTKSAGGHAVLSGCGLEY